MFYNIEELIERFEGKNIILSIAELKEVLHNFEFEGIVFNSKYNLLEKIEILYETGIIGLKFSSNYIKRKGICNTTCFVFNEGMNAFNHSKKDLTQSEKSIQFIINPIFSKKLSLHYNTTEIIGNYGWTYLRDNHARKMAIKRV